MKKSVKPYERRAQYYETDKMGVIHHSNYIRWFEEARVDYMDQLGFGFAQSEAQGVATPVVGVQCEYRAPVRFDERVSISVKMVFFSGVRATMAYEVTGEDGTLRARGETRHCFLDGAGRPVSLKRALPELYRLFLDNTEPA